MQRFLPIPPPLPLEKVPVNRHRLDAARIIRFRAIDQVAESLIVNCYSDDGIIEGAEWKDKKGHPPMLCVQWHPERIQNKESNPLSQNIKEWFFEEAKKFKV